MSPRSGLAAIAVRSGLRTWTRPPPAQGEGGTGTGAGVRSGERGGGGGKNNSARASWRRGPCWRRGSLRPAPGERGQGGPSAAPVSDSARRPLPGRHPEPPRASERALGRGSEAPVARFGCHSVAKAPRLAAAKTRDRPAAASRTGEVERRIPRADGAGRGGHWTGLVETRGKDFGPSLLGGKRKEEVHARLPSALNGARRVQAFPPPVLKEEE